MTTPRVWLYEQLTTFPGLIALIGEEEARVFAKKTMKSSKEQHPYLVYKMGFKTNADIAEVMPDDKDAYRQFAQVWAHDFHDADTGDYMKIDAVLDQVKLAIHNKSSAEHGVISAKYIEVSQDLNDETLGTLFKYARILLITKEM